MLGAIGGLTPAYRRADIRCGLDERLGCETKWTFARSKTRTDVVLSAFLLMACPKVVNVLTANTTLLRGVQGPKPDELAQ